MTTSKSLEQVRPEKVSAPVLALNIWKSLTEPSDMITEPEHRRRARLLSALLVFLIPLGFLGAVVFPIFTLPDYRPLDDPFFFAVVAGEIALIASYILGRSPYYVAGAAVALVAISLTTFSGVLIFTQSITTLLIYLVLDVLLASMLLPLRGTVIMAALNVAGAAILPLVVPGLTYQDALHPVSFILIVSCLIVVGASIREQDLAQIETQSKELSKAVTQARLANKLKDQFLATMSHELRTPLNAIIGFSEVLQMGLAGDLSERAVRAVERIHYNSDRLLQLIDDILDISKIEAGRIEIVKRPLDLGTFLSSLEATMRPQMEAKGLGFVALKDASLPKEVLTDENRLEQISLNLLSNALKFTEEGEVTVAFKKLSSDKWGIVVTDTGIGIPPHAQEIIFEKFRQVDGTSRRAYSGTGLGLAITRELALLMDGNIRVKSKPGTGSTFTVTLPLEIEG